MLRVDRGCITIRAADKVILPGVGAAGPGMARLRELGLVDVMRSLTQPVLGVCLGMQLLCAHSEEGDTECLGVIPASVRRFTEAPGLRVPHMGWNRLVARQSHPLLIAGLGDDDRRTSCTATPYRWATTVWPRQRLSVEAFSR
jgi:glutamine amidotransferase